MFRFPIAGIIVFAFVALSSGCTTIIVSQASKMADNISSAIYNNGDVESVGQAIPTFLILIDSMIEGDSKNADLLKTAAQLNDAYGGLFVFEPERRAQFSNKALNYAWRSMCAHKTSACQWSQMTFQAFDADIAQLDRSDLPYAYALGVVWLNWIQAHSDDWNAVAFLAYSERLLQQVVTLQDDYDNGMAHLYLGALSTLLPSGLGGKPEQGRVHFERAIEISNGHNMMAKVIYAQRYARLMFDQPLHNRLLTEVIEGDPNIPDYVLINTIARREAQALLADEAEYF